MTLAKYAVSDKNSKGRQFETEPTNDRNEFERDYTRVLHSEGFRRLQKKTQVFPNHEGDFFRTRLTHSLEVEQLSRTVANKLMLNEAFAAVLAIGHDLGHPPFGHLGQDTLDELMKDHGGFEHNLQAVRLVDLIESPYYEHKGLNLMFETREGLLKHCSKENALKLGDIGRRHLVGEFPPMEVQVVDWCDALAYVHADLEDAFKMGLLSPSKIFEAPGFKEAWERVSQKHPKIVKPSDADYYSNDKNKLDLLDRAVQTVIREMLSFALTDLISNSMNNIVQYKPQSVEDVRKCKIELIGFSYESLRLHKGLKAYSRKEIYEHPQVLGYRENQAQIITDLFNAYAENPSQIKGKNLDKNSESFFRDITDYISGMTDPFAMSEYARVVEQNKSIQPTKKHGFQQR